MALGPGQSTMCGGSGHPYKYSKSSTQQVYIPSNYKQDLTNCHVESAVISWEKDDTPNYRFQFPTDHEDITADVCGKIMTLKKDLFNIRFKKINNQITNPAQYNEIKKSIARLYTTIKNSK